MIWIEKGTDRKTLRDRHTKVPKIERQTECKRLTNGNLTERENSKREEKMIKRKAQIDRLTKNYLFPSFLNNH